MKTKISKPMSAAIITVKRAAQMSNSGRRKVANWLRGTADFLEVDGKKFAARFTARYLYNPRACKH